MMKRVFSLFIALCLIVGLLPAVAVIHAHAEGEVLTEQLTIGNAWTATATSDGGASYFAARTTQSYGPDVSRIGAAGRKDDPGGWVIKFAYDENNIPTLYLDGAVIDVYDETTYKFAKTFDFVKYVNDGVKSPLNIVVMSDSVIKVGGQFINEANETSTTADYFGDISITSIGDAKLTVMTDLGIIKTTGGDDIVLNANLDMELSHARASRAGVLWTYGAGDIVINGGNYRLVSSAKNYDWSGGWAAPVGAVIAAKGTGNITINDGNINIITGFYGPTASGALATSGSSAKLEINGGNINIWAINIAGIDGKNVVVNGGSVNVKALGENPAINKDAKVTLNGGSLHLEGSSGAGKNGTLTAWSKINVANYGCYTVTRNGAEADTTATGTVTGVVTYTPHKGEWVVTKEATCVIPGERTITCTECGETVTEEFLVPHDEQTVPATATCTQAGYASAVQCAVCQETLNQKTAAATGHKYVEVPAADPDCGNDGNIAHYACSNCDVKFSGEAAEDGTITYTELTESVVIPSTGAHVAGEAVEENVTETSLELVTYCVGCGKEMSRVTTCNHKEEIVPGYAATCTEPGLSDGKVCANCGETLAEQEVIDALGHTEVEVKKVEATPEAAGHEAGTKCSVCDEILSGCEVIPKHLVEMIRVDGYDDIKASTDGRCAYLVNEPVEMTAADGTTFMGSTWKLVGNWTWTEPAEWNVKYSFPKGGVPTLTLKGAILDHYDETTGQYSTAAAAYHNAILGKTFENNDVYDLRIIIEENSTITTNGTLLGDGNGEYFHNVTIESVGDAKLTTRTAKGFAVKYGDLTLNANLEMEVPKYNGTDSYPLYASGDITINGGNYNLSSSATGTSLWAGSAGSLLRAGGNITINGGNIETNSSYYSTTGGVGAIQANGGEITINGGNITINHGVICAFKTIKGTGAVIVNGGNIATEGNYYAMGAESGIMKINGGTVEMYRPGASVYHTDYPLDLSENPYWKAYAGTSTDDAKEVKEIPNTSRYIKVVSFDEAPSCEHTETTTTEQTLTNATCTVAGSKKVTVACVACGEIISETTEEIAALGHTEETIPGKAADCENTGLTEGKKCSVCGEILVAQDEIKALGHTEKTNVETVDATCETAGSVKTTVTCEVCGKTLSETVEEIKALGHTEKTTVETVDATCETAGSVKTTVTCENCGEITETTEEIAALGHKEVTTTETKDATCTEAGFVKTIVTCENCGETTETTEEIAATGKHQFDDADDSTCNTCDYVRPTAESLTMDANNKLVFVDNDETHIYHRATVYYLGDKTVADINLTNPLKAIDPNAKTYWGISDINRITMTKPGNYVIHLNYNTAGSPKYTVAKQFVVTPETASAPTIELENNKLVVTEKNDSHIYHRATVYYLGGESVSNIYDENALKAIDSKAKTYWGLDDINNVLLVNSGNYVVHLHYNTEGSAKMTVAEAFSVVASKPKITRNEYRLSVTDDDPTHTNHRVIVYFIGDADVDIYDEAALKELDPTATVRWGMNKINRTEMLKPGKYVIYLSYNLANGVKQTMVAKTTISLPVPSVWLEENGQIGTYIPTEVAHRNYVIYYLGDQTVDDIRDIDALNAIDSDPIKFDNQKQIAERGVLTEAGNYVLVMYYNYAGSNRQYISVFATLK